MNQVSVNKELLTGNIPVNSKLLTGTVPVNKELLTRTVPVNNSIQNIVLTHFSHLAHLPILSIFFSLTDSTFYTV